MATHTNQRSSKQVMEQLVNLNRMMAQVTDRQGLLSVINGQLRELVPFTYSAAMTLAPDNKTFTVFLTDPQSMSAQHPSYQYVTTQGLPVDDGIFKNTLSLDHPVCYNIQKEIDSKGEHCPIYVKMFHESGIKEFVAAPLRNERESFGMLALLSDKTGTFGKNIMELIEGTSSLVAIAASNIMVNEAVRQREAEKEMLLSLSHKIAMIREKDCLLELINNELNKIWEFDHSDIIAINNNQETISAYLTAPGTSLGNHSGYSGLPRGSYSIHDRLLDKVLGSDEPYIFSLVESHSQGFLPSYLVPANEAGLLEVAAVRLQGEKGTFGVLCFFSSVRNAFNSVHLEILKGVAGQVATAIRNISANKQLQIRSHERETLLELSFAIAKIRDKKELLDLINTELKKLFYFTHSSVSVLSSDKQHFRIYLTDPSTRSKGHTDFDQMMDAKLSDP